MLPATCRCQAVETCSTHAVVWLQFALYLRFVFCVVMCSAASASAYSPAKAEPLPGTQAHMTRAIAGTTSHRLTNCLTHPYAPKTRTISSTAAAAPKAPAHLAERSPFQQLSGIQVCFVMLPLCFFVPRIVASKHIVAQLIRASDGQRLELVKQWGPKDRAVVAFARSLGCPFCWCVLC